MLALKNWTETGDRSTAPYLKEVFQIRVSDGTLDADELSTALRPDSRSVFKNETADDRLDRILDLDGIWLQ